MNIYGSTAFQRLFAGCVIISFLFSFHAWAAGDDAEANRLFVNGVQRLAEIKPDTSDAERASMLSEVLMMLERIEIEHPDTNLGQRLANGEAIGKIDKLVLTREVISLEDQLASALLAEAEQLVERALTGEDVSASSDLVDQAETRLDEIRNLYPRSEAARRLETGETAGGVSLSLIKQVRIDLPTLPVVRQLEREIKEIGAAVNENEAVARFDAAITLFGTLVAKYPTTSFAVRIISGEEIGGTTPVELEEAAAQVHLQWLRTLWDQVFEATTVDALEEKLDAAAELLARVAAKYPNSAPGKRIAAGEAVEGVDLALITQTREDAPALVEIHRVEQLVASARIGSPADATEALWRALQRLDEIVNEYPATSVAVRIMAQQPVSGITRVDLVDEAVAMEVAHLADLWSQVEQAEETTERLRLIDLAVVVYDRLAERYENTPAGQAVLAGDPVNGISRRMLNEARLDAPVLAKVTEIEALFAKAEQAEPRAVVDLYAQAHATMSAIVAEHGNSSIAVKIISGEPVVGATLDSLEEAIINAHWRVVVELSSKADATSDIVAQARLLDAALVAFDEFVARYADHPIAKRLSTDNAVDEVSRVYLMQARTDVSAQAALGDLQKLLAEAETMSSPEQKLAAYDRALETLDAVAQDHGDASFIADGSLNREIEAIKQDVLAAPFVATASRKIIEAKAATAFPAVEEALAEAMSILAKMKELYPLSSYTRAATDGEGIEGLTLAKRETAALEIALARVDLHESLISTAIARKDLGIVHAINDPTATALKQNLLTAAITRGDPSFKLRALEIALARPEKQIRDAVVPIALANLNEDIARLLLAHDDRQTQRRVFEALWNSTESEFQGIAYGFLSGEWHGQYSYTGGRNPVNFVLSAQFDRTGQLSGRSSEPNTFGDRSAKELFAHFSGYLSSSGTVSMIKTYDGTGRVSHSVDLDGRFEPESHRIRGTWKVRGNSGPFVMTRR